MVKGFEIMKRNSTWLLLLLGIVFLLRIPTFFEPNWYGDEAIYLTVGQNLQNGLLLYRDIYDNKPPFIYLLAGLAGSLFWFKVILAFWNLATIFLFYKLTKVIWPKNESLAKYSTIIFALLTTLPLLEGNIANAELFMILPTIAAFYLLLSGKLTTSRLLAAGVIMGLGVLFKIPSIVDAGVPIAVWLAALFVRQIKPSKFIKQTFLFAAGIAVPVALSILIFGLMGAGKEYIIAAFFQTIGYLSSWHGTQGDLLTRNQPLIIRGILSLGLVAVLILLAKQKKVSASFLFAGAWFSFSLFGALLSERPYPHYLIQAVPSFSLLLGIAFNKNSREQFFAYPLFFLLGAALIFYKFNYYPVFSYYENFTTWAVKLQNEKTFFSRFDARTPRNYEIARYLSQSAKEEDRLFVWGDDPELYSLTRLTPSTKYAVAYHIKERGAFEEVANTLLANPPRFMVTTLSEESFPKLADILTKYYLPVNQVQTAKIWLYIAKE